MIDKNKTYKTSDGREVRIYAVDGGANRNAVHGAIFSGYWSAHQWFPDGKYFDGGTHHNDLIEVRPRIKREVWVNVYPDGLLCYHDSREKADGAGKWCGRIACVRLTIDCEEGEGL